MKRTQTKTDKTINKPADVQPHVILWVMAILITVTGLAGCDLYGQDDYEEQFVIESYLIAREPLPELRISTTAPFYEPYNFDERAVSNAEVRIYVYDESDDLRYTFPYFEQRPGIYTPADQDTGQRVLPRHTYRLEIDAPLPNGDMHRIEAQTIVPDTSSIRNVIRDQAVYQSQTQLEFRITNNRTYDRQNYFIFSTKSLEPNEDNLTPFWNDALDDEEDYRDAIRIRTNIVNEGNFSTNPDGTLTLRMPWIGIAFYGPNTISTYTLDDNTYDYFRSQPSQTGGGAGTISPGEIQNIIHHVDGGIGLFGSMSVLDMDVEVLRDGS